jgi:transcriptional regulator with XRE-family HTH domain
MNYYPEFATLLNQYLNDVDRPAAWLAKRLEVSTSTVTRWLNGQTRPGKPETVVRMADILGVYGSTERQSLLSAAGYAYQETRAEFSHAPMSALPDTDRADKGRSIALPPISPEGQVISLERINHFEGPRQDWGEAPDVGRFYGRQVELALLKQWLIADHCQLVGVLGLGGIGKTALATKLAIQIAAYPEADSRSLAKHIGENGVGDPP